MLKAGREGKMKIRIVFALALFTAASAFTWAQGLPGSIWNSPQSATSEGRYRSNADDFIRPDAYAGVRFNKWFGLASFGTAGTATLGLASKTESLYISAFYNGNFWAGAPANNYTQQSFTPGTQPAGAAANTTYNVYGAISVTPVNVNNFAVLLGFADMGLRLTYRTNYQLFSQNNIVTGAQLYKSYHAEEGYISPQIAWSLSKDLVSGKGVRPWATVDIDFNRNYLKTETEGGITGTRVQRSQNESRVTVNAGLGSFHFYNKDGFRGSLDVEYLIGFRGYDNEFSYAAGGQYNTVKFNGTYNGVALVGNSYFTNTLTPSIAGSWSKDRLALRFKLNLPLTLTVTEENALNFVAGSIVKNGNSDKTTSFILTPDLRLALQYKIIPDRLNLNAGARIQATALTLSEVERENYTNGNRNSSVKNQNNSFGSSTGLASRFSIGATFLFTENAWVEASTGVSNANGSTAIQVFGTAASGLFTFGSILACVKF